jgi:hypothetical protein
LCWISHWPGTITQLDGGRALFTARHPFHPSGHTDEDLKFPTIKKLVFEMSHIADALGATWTR